MGNPVELLNFRFFRGTGSLPVVLQSEASECGLAALTMVAGYHGFKTDLIQMRNRAALSLDGMDMIQLMELADSIGLGGRPIRLETADLKEFRHPAILHWDMDHFVVLKKATDRFVEIHDPGSGYRRMSLEEASRHFTGIALELYPTADFARHSEVESMTFFDFWRSIRGLKGWLLKLLLLSVVLQVFSLASPYYMKLVVDEVLTTNNETLLVALAAGFGMLMLISTLIQSFRSYVTMHFGNQLSIQIGSNLFRHLIRLPMAFYEKRHIGDVVSRFGANEQIKSLLTTGLIETLLDGVMAITTGVMIFLISPTLAWVVVGFLLGSLLLQLLFYRPIRRLSEEAIVAGASQSSNFMETVRGIQSIKLFAREQQRHILWQNRYADTLNAGIKLGNLNILQGICQSVLMGLENILVIFLAIKFIMADVLSLGILFAFLAYKGQFSGNINALISRYIQFKMLGLHLERLSDITLNKKEQHLTVSTPVKPKNFDFRIENASFRYSDRGRLILDELNLHIKQGECVAIVGPSGCGKSTLMKVMLGLAHPHQGQVVMGDVDIRDMGLSEYRKCVAAVMQNDQLLSGTIAENISFFDTQADMEKIHRCAYQACIHEDIDVMPLKYNSLIGDMGSSLSGGQKQRILLARALYKSPFILFMDEATSHLDVMLEKSINQVLQQFNCTRVIISHRPQTIEMADRVLKLDKGKLTELDKNDAEYRRCVDKPDAVPLFSASR